MIEAPTVNALPLIARSMAIAVINPFKRRIQACSDNARYHHAGTAKEWLARPGCRIKLRMSEAHQMPLDRVQICRMIVPAYCPRMSLSND